MREVLLDVPQDRLGFDPVPRAGRRDGPLSLFPDHAPVVGGPGGGAALDVVEGWREVPPAFAKSDMEASVHAPDRGAFSISSRWRLDAPRPVSSPFATAESGAAPWPPARYRDDDVRPPPPAPWPPAPVQPRRVFPSEPGPRCSRRPRMSRARRCRERDAGLHRCGCPRSIRLLRPGGGGCGQPLPSRPDSGVTPSPSVFRRLRLPHRAERRVEPLSLWDCALLHLGRSAFGRLVRLAELQAAGCSPAGGDSLFHARPHPNRFPFLGEAESGPDRSAWEIPRATSRRSVGNCPRRQGAGGLPRLRCPGLRGRCGGIVRVAGSAADVAVEPPALAMRGLAAGFQAASFSDDKEQRSLRALFMSDERFDVRAVVRHCEALPGSSACVLLSRTARSSPVRATARERASPRRPPAMLGAVVTLAEGLGLSDAESFSMRTDRGIGRASSGPTLSISGCSTATAASRPACRRSSPSPASNLRGWPIPRPGRAARSRHPDAPSSTTPTATSSSRSSTAAPGWAARRATCSTSTPAWGAVGAVISVRSQHGTDRTIFFDFLPVNAMEINGYKVRFQLYTVPGQACFSDSRSMVLRGVDGIVFVRRFAFRATPGERRRDGNGARRSRRASDSRSIPCPGCSSTTSGTCPGSCRARSSTAISACRDGGAVPRFEVCATSGFNVFGTLDLLSRLDSPAILCRRRRASPAAATAAPAIRGALAAPEFPPIPSIVPPWNPPPSRPCRAKVPKEAYPATPSGAALDGFCADAGVAFGALVDESGAVISSASPRGLTPRNMPEIGAISAGAFGATWLLSRKLGRKRLLRPLPGGQTLALFPQSRHRRCLSSLRLRRRYPGRARAGRRRACPERPRRGPRGGPRTSVLAVNFFDFPVGERPWSPPQSMIMTLGRIGLPAGSSPTNDHDRPPQQGRPPDVAPARLFPPVRRHLRRTLFLLPPLDDQRQ